MGRDLRLDLLEVHELRGERAQSSHSVSFALSPPGAFADVSANTASSAATSFSAAATSFSAAASSAAREAREASAASSANEASSEIVEPFKGCRRADRHISAPLMLCGCAAHRFGVGWASCYAVISVCQFLQLAAARQLDRTGNAMQPQGDAHFGR